MIVFYHRSIFLFSSDSITLANRFIDSEPRCKVTEFFVYFPNLFSSFFVLFFFKTWRFVLENSLIPLILRLQSSEVFLKLPNLFLQLFVFFIFFSNRGLDCKFQPKFESLKKRCFNLSMFVFCFVASDCWCQTRLQS